MATKEGGSAKLTWSNSHQVILKLWSSDNVVVLNRVFNAAVLPDGMILYDDDGDVVTDASLQNVAACYSVKYKGDQYHFAEVGIRPGSTPQRRQEQQLLQNMFYLHGAQNGVDPAKFHPRVAAENVIGSVPEQVENWSDDGANLRILLYGPPGSGKTSIMGKVDQRLRERYAGTQVFFVRATELKLRQDEVVRALSGIHRCVVLLDDAQEWFDYAPFWDLFKASNRLLVCAATYPVVNFNGQTPVNIQVRETTNLHPQEIDDLLTKIGVEQSHHEDMKLWFGDNYGRYHILVPGLLHRWNQIKENNPTTSLADTFYLAETMQDEKSSRLLPTLSEGMRSMLMAEIRGQLNQSERKKLVRYGIFDEQGNWSCEYVRRKYFTDLFRSDDIDTSLFDSHSGLPPELELLKAGLKGTSWTRVKQSAGSSLTGFPIEEIWQAEFYANICKFIPTQFVFCKEFVARTDNRVDFVLRNGSTRAIEFLVKSSDVVGHHKRFESGAYNSLRLSGSYLVVDVKPWGQEPDIHEVSDETRLRIASACFEAISVSRRRNHALFLVSNGLSSGILYIYNVATSSVEECLRSPPPLAM